VSGPGHTLFHRIAQPESARIRLLVVELGLEAEIDFQNAETDAKDDRRLGSAATPALWDGHRLISGETSVAEALKAMRPAREDGW
jgi:hypothetical protein